MKYIILTTTIILLLMTIVIADESFVFQQNKIFTLDIAMSNNNLSECTTCTCKISIFYPNGTALIRNAAGTNTDGFCKYSSSSNIMGTHSVEMISTNGVDHGRATFEIEITPQGDLIKDEFNNTSIFLIIAVLISIFMYFFITKIIGSMGIFITGIGILFNNPQFGWIGWIIIASGIIMLLFSVMDTGKKRKKRYRRIR